MLSTASPCATLGYVLDLMELYESRSKTDEHPTDNKNNWTAIDTATSRTASEPFDAGLWPVQGSPAARDC